MARDIRQWTARIPQRVLSAGLLVASLLVSGILFAQLDRAYTRYLSGKYSRGAECLIPDPLLHHVLKPNCAGIKSWGRITYPFYTNSLGLRDERIRDVPLAVSETRILLLGDSFTEGVLGWNDTFAAMIAARLPQLQILNGGVSSYSPSNYLNLTKRLLEAGVRFDEVVVFLDISDIQEEAAYYRDNEQTGGVDGPAGYHRVSSWWARQRIAIAHRYAATDTALTYLEYLAIRSGLYFKPLHETGNVFDRPRGSWTFRPVPDTVPYIAGFAPLGLAGGIAKALRKMSLLHEELARRGIALSVVVYPWPPQLAHDVVESRHVTLWRDWCEGKCKRFISVFPDFFAIKDACPWYAPGCWYDYFVFGDDHFNARGNRVIADAVARRLIADPPNKARQQ